MCGHTLMSVRLETLGKSALVSGRQHLNDHFGLCHPVGLYWAIIWIDKEGTKALRGRSQHNDESVMICKATTETKLPKNAIK